MFYIHLFPYLKLLKLILIHNIISLQVKSYTNGALDYNPS